MKNPFGGVMYRYIYWEKGKPDFVATGHMSGLETDEDAIYHANRWKENLEKKGYVFGKLERIDQSEKVKEIPLK